MTKEQLQKICDHNYELAYEYKVVINETRKIIKENIIDNKFFSGMCGSVILTKELVNYLLEILGEENE